MHFFSLITSICLAFVFGNLVQAAPTKKPKPHDWHECDHVALPLRLDFNVPHFPLPRNLPERYKGSLECNPAPKGKYADAHCSKVWEGVRRFCDRNAYDMLRKRIDPSHGAELAIYNAKYDPDFAPKNTTDSMVRRFPEDDDYLIKVNQVPYCGDPRELWDQRYTADKWCEAMLWGTWSQCDNKGRGGQLTHGCLTYNFTVLQ